MTRGVNMPNMVAGVLIGASENAAGATLRAPTGAQVATTSPTLPADDGLDWAKRTHAQIIQPLLDKAFDAGLEEAISVLGTFAIPKVREALASAIRARKRSAA